MKKFIFEHSDIIYFIIGVLSGFGVNIITNEIELNIYFGFEFTFLGIILAIYLKSLLGKFNKFEYFIIHGSWEKRIFNELETLICTNTDEYQLILGDVVVSNFSQPWIDYADMEHNESIKLTLKKNGTIINEFTWLKLDGYRVFMPIPEYDSKNNFYYFNKNSLKYNMMCKIGEYGNEDDSFEELFLRVGIKII